MNGADWHFFASFLLEAGPEKGIKAEPVKIAGGEFEVAVLRRF